MSGKKEKSKPKKIEINGIHARVIRGPRPDGSWYWQAQRYTDGSSSTVWSGWATRDDAQLRLADLVRGVDVVEEQEEHEEERCDTIKDLLELFLKSYRQRQDLSPATVATAKRRAKLVVSYIGSVHVERIGIAQLEDFRDRYFATKGRKADTKAASTVFQGAITVLISAWRWGRARKHVPATDLPRPRFSVERATPAVTPESDDLWRVLDALPSVAPRSPWVHLFGLLLAGTGARPGGIASLTWESIDFQRQIIEINDKTGRRSVPVADDLLDALRTYQPSEELRTGRVLPVAPRTAIDTFGYAWHKACESAGVPDCEPYAIRRAACDALYRSGVDVGTAAAVLGHSPTVALAHYRRATEADKRKAMALAGLGSRPRTSKVVELRQRTA